MRKIIILGLSLFTLLVLFLNYVVPAQADTCYRTCPGYNGGANGYTCYDLGCSWLSGCGADGFCFYTATCGQTYSCNTCTPRTCSYYGSNACGSHSDGCGGTISCGGCSSGYTCSGGYCACDSSQQNYWCSVNNRSCGTWSVCTGTNNLNCGTCTPPATCSYSGSTAGKCIQTCGGYCSTDPAYAGCWVNTWTSTSSCSDTWNATHNCPDSRCTAGVTNPPTVTPVTSNCPSGCVGTRSYTSCHSSCSAYGYSTDTSYTCASGQCCYIPGACATNTPVPAACPYTCRVGVVGGCYPGESDVSSSYPACANGGKCCKPAPTSPPSCVKNKITGHVYIDNNGNGVYDTGDTYYDGATVSLSGTQSGSDVSGDATYGTGYIQFLNLSDGSYTVTLTVPGGYHATTTNPRSISFTICNTAEIGTANFGIALGAVATNTPTTAPATNTPTPAGTNCIDYSWNTSISIPDSPNTTRNCSVGSEVSSSQTITETGQITDVNLTNLNISSNGNPLGNLRVMLQGPTGTGTYTMFDNICSSNANISGLVLDSDFATPVGNNCATPYTGTFAPQQSMTNYNSVQSGSHTWRLYVKDCQRTFGAPGLLTRWGLRICYAPPPTYTININFPIDNNPPNGQHDPAEQCYGGLVDYYINGVLQGQITSTTNCNPISINTTATGPLTFGNIPNYYYTGWRDSTGFYTSDPDIASINGPIEVYLSDSVGWFQARDGDLRMDRGFVNIVPGTSSCSTWSNTVTSLTGTGLTPGVIFSGDNPFNFCLGGTCQDKSSSKQWVAGGTSYGEKYNPLLTKKTSYSYLMSRANQTGITPTDLTAFCMGSGGKTTSNCSLTGLSEGVYVFHGDLGIAATTFTAGKNFVILVDGNLTIKGDVLIPNGSTAVFAAGSLDADLTKGNIIIDSNVGTTSTSVCTAPTTAGATGTNCNISGLFSADQDFIIQHNTAISCPTSDKRLNIAGSVVVNAAGTGGKFINQRDLCSVNLTCPSSAITSRPDFILNLPEVVKQPPSYIWQELAP